MNNKNFINKMKIYCICSVIFVCPLFIQAGKSSENTKPGRTKQALEIVGCFIDPQGFLTLNIHGKSRDLYGLRIKEQYMDANGAVFTRQEDYPVWVESPSGPAIYRDGVRSCFIDVNIRERKDEKKWQKYLDNVRLRHELAKSKREGKYVVDIEPEKINRPPVWISVPEANKVRVFVSVYSKAGQESEDFELNEVFSFLMLDFEKSSDKDYDEPSEWMAQTPATTLPPDTNNAALLYYQAFLSRPKPDDTTFELINEVLRGVEPDNKSGLLIRKYLKNCRESIKYARAASYIPQCDWGPVHPQPYNLSMSVILESRRLCQLLNLYARALAAEKEYRAAFDSSLVIRRLAAHVGDDTFLMYSTSQMINTMALRCIMHVLGSMSTDVDTLTWLRNQINEVQGTPFRPAQVLKKWNDRERQSWRAHPEDIKKWREVFSQAAGDDSARKEFIKMTDEQILARVTDSHERLSKTALEIIGSDKTYGKKYTELLKLKDPLDPGNILGDPFAFLSTSARTAENYYKFVIRNTACLNVVRAAIEIYLINAKIGQLPKILPVGLPKDPYTGQDFEYRITEEGFVLGFDPEHIDNLRLRQFNFKVKK